MKMATTVIKIKGLILTFLYIFTLFSLCFFHLSIETKASLNDESLGRIIIALIFLALLLLKALTLLVF
jgi:hypothetical protein